jgi:hypothetical protein
MTRLVLVLLIPVLGAAAKDQPLDMAAVRAEPNLEKRSEKALDYASQLIDRAGKSYRAGELSAAHAQANEAAEAAELCYQSLAGTGKNPSRSPKHFKRAELKTRQLARRLETLAAGMGYDEREPVEKARRRVQKVNEDLLAGIMTGKLK